VVYDSLTVKRIEQESFCDELNKDFAEIAKREIFVGDFEEGSAQHVEVFENAIGDSQTITKSDRENP
jgi:hypothetical protein